MIPAFLDTYTGSGGGSLDLIPSLTKLLPNWTIRYSGLGKLKWFNEHFKSVNINHSYKSVFALGSYTSSSETASILGWNVPTVSINESFSPLIGVDVTFLNNMTLKAEYKTARVSTLSITSAQINETSSKDFVIGWGWKINDFRLSSLFGGGKASKQAAKSNRSRRGSSASSRNTSASSRDKASSSSSSSSSKKAFAHDLNLRFDFSLRDPAAIRRDIQSGLCEATSGQLAIKASAQIDYTMSRYITMSIYYDRQHSKPLLSSQSYPTVTQDFGMTMKVSLTR
jgi:cell surface protein SprA